MSTVSQAQLRYLSVDTIADLKAQIHAFPGNLSLVKENKVLYQYVEYTGTLPAADDETIVAVNDVTATGRWIALDTYSTKSVSGTFVKSDWVYNSTTDTYTYTVNLVNPINNFFSKLTESVQVNGTTAVYEVLPQEVELVKSGDAVTSVVFHVGSKPDCRFAGSYLILKDRLS